ncbi:MAG: type II secretion system F family protein [Acidimicrobiia bacterium]
MPIHVIAAAVSIAVAVPLLWFSVASSSAGASRAGSAVPDIHQMTLQRSATDRVLRPMVGSLASRVRGLTPRGWVKSLERRATLAGVPENKVERYLAAKLLAIGVGGLSVPFVMGAAEPTKALLIAAVITVGAFFAPDGILDTKAKARQELIQNDLPDTLDQIMISVEAGLGFEAALGRAGKAGGGPLAEEILRTLYEMQMGAQRRDALHNLANRSSISDLRNFVFAVTQSEQYGLPIAETLRIQAAELRDKRQQRAEERAVKIPVKITFPLVLCIFPTLFIVLLGPAAIQVWNGILA